MNIETLESKSNIPKILEISLDSNCYVKDALFLKTDNNLLHIGGFYKDVLARVGVDFVNCGMFSFTIDLASNTIKSKVTKVFDDTFLKELDVNNKKSKHYIYKLDYILPVGNDIYYVGRQYYHFTDLIIAKLNSKGEFEWGNNIFIKKEIDLSKHFIFRPYSAFATENSMYILYNDYRKNLAIYKKPNFKIRKLRTIKNLSTTNFVCTSYALKDGTIQRELLFRNKPFRFTPFQVKGTKFKPPSEADNFIINKGNEIIVYSRKRNTDRFSKLFFK